MTTGPHEGRVARRYAAAIEQAALSAGCHARVLADLEDIVAMASTLPDLARLFEDRTVCRAARVRAVNRLFEGRVHAMTLRFLNLLAERRRLPLLASATAVLRECAERRAGVRRVSVTVARPPSTDAVEALAAGLRRASGGEVRMIVSVKPDLVGGFTARMGDVQVDLSVAGALRAFRRRVSASPVENRRPAAIAGAAG